MIAQNLAALARHLDLERRLVLPVFRLRFEIKQGLDTQSGQLAKQGPYLWRINAQAATGRWYKPRQRERQRKSHGFMRQTSNSPQTG